MQIVGLVSFVPRAATLFATTFDFQKRATFHRRKARLLDELRGRFIYQMPTLASADQIALIHQELTGIEAKLAIDEDNIVVNFKVPALALFLEWFHRKLIALAVLLFFRSHPSPLKAVAIFVLSVVNCSFRHSDLGL